MANPAYPCAGNRHMATIKCNNFSQLFWASETVSAATENLFSSCWNFNASLIYHVLWFFIPDKNYMVLVQVYREPFLKQKCLSYLFDTGGLVSGRLSQSGIQRRLAAHCWTQGTTGHSGWFAGTVTQLVEAALQPAVTTNSVLRSVINSEHYRLPSLGLQMKESERKQKYYYCMKQTLLPNHLNMDIQCASKELLILQP